MQLQDTASPTKSEVAIQPTMSLSCFPYCIVNVVHRSSKDAFQYSWPVIANLAKNAHPQQCEFVSLKPLDNQFVHFVPVATNRTGNECVLMVIIR